MKKQYSAITIAAGIWLLTNLVFGFGWICTKGFFGVLIGILSTVVSFPVVIILAIVLPAIKKSSVEHKLTALLLVCLSINLCYAYVFGSNIDLLKINLLGLDAFISYTIVLFSCSLIAMLISLKSINGYFSTNLELPFDKDFQQDFKTQTNINMETTNQQTTPQWDNRPTNANTNKVLIKAIIVAVLTLAMLVPTTLISNMVIERQAHSSAYARLTNVAPSSIPTVAAQNYEKTMRTTKYAILVIGLTFAVFFLIELLQKRPVHPVQYTLVGLALAIFYTLLLSIGEYILFDYAYIISSLATISLITLYVKSHFQYWKPATALGGTLITLYGFILVLVSLEETALIIGSIGLFVVLSIVMYVTRNINWYNPALAKNVQVQ
jgi:hypothetical protein